MNIRRLGETALCAVAASLLVACGGGTVAGISGTGITSGGTVTAVGSVFVNGVEFDTDDATIIVDGEPASEADLFVGQVVTVTGTLETESSGTARTVIAERLVDGPVEALNRQNTVVTALDQTVLLDASTVFIGFSRSDLDRFNLIAVSGFINDRDQIVATAVRRGAETFVYGAGISTDVVGETSGLGSTSFEINGLRVVYGGIAVDESAGALSNGARVQVFGTQSKPGGVFAATSVRVLDPTLAEPGRRVELEGIVSDFSGSGDFSISGQPVDASTAEDDTGQALSAGLRVEVEGTINDAGVLVADALIIKPTADIFMTTTIDAVNSARGTIKVFDRPIEVNAATRYQDKSAVEDHGLRLQGLQFSDRVEILAARNAADHLVARRITRTDFDPSATLNAPVVPGNCDVRARTLTVAGITVSMNSARLKSRDGINMNLAGFCAVLSEGGRVAIEGSANGGELVAEMIQLR